MNNESLPTSLIKSVVNDYTTDSLKELSETVLDTSTNTLINSELIEKIPVMGLLIGLSKGVLDFKNRRYASKILSFLAETSKASNEERVSFAKKLKDNPKENKRAAAIILDIIDKITTNEKAIMIAKVYRAHMIEDMSTSQLIYLCEIIQKSYLQDLESLQKSEIHNDVNLENVGIKKPIRVEDINEVILKAVNQAVEEATSRAGVVTEAFTAEQIEEKKLLPQVKQSGLTHEGDTLMRILRSY